MAYASPAVGRDRKSTRLNSSHVEISYAVFCLKKKKKQKFNPCPHDANSGGMRSSTKWVSVARSASFLLAHAWTALSFVSFILFFFFNDTATTEIYTLSLHDALPISPLPNRQPFALSSVRPNSFAA